jgi:hypothetical protein
MGDPIELEERKQDYNTTYRFSSRETVSVVLVIIQGAILAVIKGANLMAQGTSIKTPSVSTGDMQRQLHGTAFLSLEHWAYIVLAVLLPLLLLGGFHAAMAVWTNRGTDPIAALVSGGILTQFFGSLTVTFTALLLTLASLMFILQRRTEGEFAKRPDYKHRLAYKLPIYGGLAMLAIFKVISFCSLLAAFLESLTLIGVKGADIGGLYLTQFLPSLLALVVFAAAAWYLMRLAKGYDKSSLYSLVMLCVSVLLSVALFTTAVMAAHKDIDRTPPMPMPVPMNSDSYHWME